MLWVNMYVHTSVPLILAPSRLQANNPRLHNTCAPWTILHPACSEGGCTEYDGQWYCGRVPVHAHVYVNLGRASCKMLLQALRSAPLLLSALCPPRPCQVAERLWRRSAVPIQHQVRIVPGSPRQTQSQSLRDDVFWTPRRDPTTLVSQDQVREKIYQVNDDVTYSNAHVRASVSPERGSLVRPCPHRIRGRYNACLQPRRLVGPSGVAEIRSLEATRFFHRKTKVESLFDGHSISSIVPCLVSNGLRRGTCG